MAEDVLYNCFRSSRLTGAYGLFHIYENEINGSPQEVCLELDGGKFFTFRTGPVGSTVRILTGLPKEKDLGEYGEEKLLDLSKNSVFSQCLGKRIIYFSEIRSLRDEIDVGVFFGLEIGCCFSIVSLGDEIDFYGKIPHALLSSELLALKEESRSFQL
ncbi:hypothetical protein [uncultured Pseudomonas sp.]|uniref:hypothetical protein n=1 Tax=uncultured Pseudomonas sp. TaxID=114707 RepID=UPI0025DE06F0|nr:hypothetical protein [uncultured Pseudomonas sp.]